MSGPPPLDGSYRNGSIFLKYILRPVFIIGSLVFYHCGSSGRGGGTRNARLSLFDEVRVLFSVDLFIDESRG